MSTTKVGNDAEAELAVFFNESGLTPTERERVRQIVKRDTPPLTDSMVLYAFRYCLGRRTYAVWECVEYLLTFWEHISEDTRAIICRDIEDALKRGGAGMDMDRVQWQRILDRAA